MAESFEIHEDGSATGTVTLGAFGSESAAEPLDQEEFLNLQEVLEDPFKRHELALGYALDVWATQYEEIDRAIEPEDKLEIDFLHSGVMIARSALITDGFLQGVSEKVK